VRQRLILLAITFSKTGWRLFGALVLGIAAVVAAGAWIGNGTAAGDSIGVPGQEKFVIQEQHRAAMFFLLAVSLELVGGMLISPILPTHDSEPSFARLALGSVLGAVLLVLVTALVLMAFVEVTSLHRMDRHGFH
jgi:hypothetical protein